jgi:hypothetical protein
MPNGKKLQPIIFLRLSTIVSTGHHGRAQSYSNEISGHDPKVRLANGARLQTTNESLGNF